MGTQFQGDQTPQEEPTQPAGGQPAVSGQPSTGITPEQLDARLKEFADSLEETFTKTYRGVQSNNDQAVSRMQKVQAEIERALQGFPGATPEQIRQFSRERAIDAMFEQQQPAPAGTVPGQGQPAQPGQNGNGQQPSEPVHWADAAVMQLVESTGFDILEGEPGFAEIAEATKNPDPWVYINAYRQALEQKAERLGKQTQARLTTQGTGTSSPANDISSITDPSELFKIARERGKI